MSRLCIFILISLFLHPVYGPSWVVDSWQPPFNYNQSSQDKRIIPLKKASKHWRLCALYPHLKDSYWQSVNYGVHQQAKRLGVEVQVYEAGGYNQEKRQQEQLTSCIKWQADAVLLGAINFDDLIWQITKQTKDTPVFGLVNNLPSQGTKGKVGVNWFQTGYRVGNYLHLLHKRNNKKIRVAWFPGPLNKGGSNVTEQGFKQGIMNSPIEIVAVRRGDNGKEIQRSLLQEVLEQHSDLDYIVGGAVAAEVAITELRTRGLEKKLKLSVLILAIAFTVDY